MTFILFLFFLIRILKTVQKRIRFKFFSFQFVDPKSIDDKSSWSFIYLLFSLSLLDPWRACPANFSNLYMLPINWVFSFSVLFSNEPKKKREGRRRRRRRRRGHILRLLRTEQSSFSFSLSFSNETRNNYIHWCGRVRGAIRKRDGEEKKEKKGDLSFTYITMPSLKILFFFCFYQPYVFF